MQVRYPVFVVLCSSYHATVFPLRHGCCCCCFLASCCCIGCGFGTSTFGTSFVTDICVFVVFSISLLLFWRDFWLFGFLYSILSWRSGWLTVVVLLPLPGSVQCQNLFSRYPCLVEHFAFVFVSVVFVSPQHLSKNLWLVGKKCRRHRDIQTFIDLSAIACFLPLSLWFVLIFFLVSRLFCSFVSARLSSFAFISLSSSLQRSLELRVSTRGS